jgi:hypothetical protein
VTLNICIYYSSSSVQLAIKKLWQSLFASCSIISPQYHNVPLFSSHLPTCTLLPLYVWAATAALRVDSGGGVASGRRRRCKWTVKAAREWTANAARGWRIRFLTGATSEWPRRRGGFLQVSNPTLPWCSLISGRSPTVPYFVPVRSVPRLGTKFPEQETCHRSWFLSDNYIYKLIHLLCLPEMMVCIATLPT